MSYSTTYSETQTFSITDAKKLSAKVATDLKRIQRFYGNPSDSEINTYETEVIELLRNGYLNKVTYGFMRNDNWIEPTLIYTAKELTLGVDDDPGRIHPNADVAGAYFHSYLTYSVKWDRLSLSEKDTFKKSLPFYRSGAIEPGINGYLSQDLTYSSGGRSLSRSTVKSY